jgi:hypothetical protein
LRGVKPTDLVAHRQSQRDILVPRHPSLLYSQARSRQIQNLGCSGTVLSSPVKERVRNTPTSTVRLIRQYTEPLSCTVQGLVPSPLCNKISIRLPQVYDTRASDQPKNNIHPRFGDRAGSTSQKQLLGRTVAGALAKLQDPTTWFSQGLRVLLYLSMY